MAMPSRDHHPSAGLGCSPARAPGSPDAIFAAFIATSQGPHPVRSEVPHLLFQTLDEKVFLLFLLLSCKDNKMK